VLFGENDDDRINDDTTITPPKNFSTPVKKLRVNSRNNHISLEQHLDMKKRNKQLEFEKSYREYSIFGRRICHTHLVALDKQISTVSDIN